MGRLIDADRLKEVFSRNVVGGNAYFDLIDAQPTEETPQEPQTFKWCTYCKEYDQEKHCCHRWSKVIRDTVEEMKQEQEPRWIPVSERLPDTDDEVLCWYEYYHWSREKVLPEYGLGQYFKETKAWFGEVAVGKNVRVIAWQPLPKPYKAESEDKEAADENM